MPFFIFIIFEFANASNANLANHEIEEEIEYNTRIKYNNNIINYLYNEHIIFGIRYKLIGIINTPSIHHYNGIIINLGFKHKNLDLNRSYIYDGLMNNNGIIYVDD